MYRLVALLLVPLVTLGGTRGPTDPERSALRPAPDLAGTYVLDRKASDDPRRAVDQALTSMRRFKRNAIKKRLDDGMKPADTLHVRTSGDTVAITTSGRMRLTTVPGGEARTLTGQNGRSMQIASGWEGSALVVRMTSASFRRETRYALDDANARLRVEVTTTAERLAQPIHYTLVYDRVASDTTASP
ncbi:MAG: hypothetical protein IRY91_10140 [Gemmatimonadaceae bacterium]|nr:hypothetical protein [Gemmatimonadaceae bacterium]